MARYYFRFFKKNGDVLSQTFTPHTSLPASDILRASNERRLQLLLQPLLAKRFGSLMASETGKTVINTERKLIARLASVAFKHGQISEYQNASK